MSGTVDFPLLMRKFLALLQALMAEQGEHHPQMKGNYNFALVGPQRAFGEHHPQMKGNYNLPTEIRLVGNPDVGNPIVGNPIVGNPIVGNPREHHPQMKGNYISEKSVRSLSSGEHIHE